MYFIKIVCWQTILMNYQNFFFFEELENMLQNLSSAAVVIGALRVNLKVAYIIMICEINIYRKMPRIATSVPSHTYTLRHVKVQT